MGLASCFCQFGTLSRSWIFDLVGELPTFGRSAIMKGIYGQNEIGFVVWSGGHGDGCDTGV